MQNTETKKGKMMKRMFFRVLRLAKGTSMVVGLAVMIALTAGVASEALAAKNKSATLKLGVQNAVSAVTSMVGSVAGPVLKLDNNGAGPALDLQVEPGQAPMTVNSGQRVDNLNSDRLDGKDSAEFLTANQKAADAERLDGKDSSEFATRTSEAWHEIGAPGEPTFNDDPTFGTWVNFDANHNSAAFYKDPLGIVHLKGTIKKTKPTSGTHMVHCHNYIFNLPQGYRPPRTSVFTVPASIAVPGGDTTLRVNVDSSGAIHVCDASLATNKQWRAGDWISLDGISFRAN